MTEIATFDALALSSDVRQAIDAMGYVTPTPVQLAVYESAARGRNLVVQARTGTGKTTAFGLPLIDQLVKKGTPKVQALVLAPTRELALQVAAELEKIARFRQTKISVIYGGASMSKQVSELEAGAQLVVGTPGRVLDHLKRKTLDPSAIRALVLDEADEMLSMGFARELSAILEVLPKERQTLLFSATLPPDITRMAESHLKDPEFVTLSGDQVGALEIAHYVYLVSGDKKQALSRVIEVENPESAILFCNTREETERTAQFLADKGFDADWLNGDLDQRAREEVMQRTREGKLRFLVATDVAARGIDISHLTHVINFDFPESPESYIHRTGRTGRAGRMGTAVSLVSPRNVGALYLVRLLYKIRPIEKLLPSQQEMKTRAESDLVQVFVDAFGARDVHPEDLALARRLLTHDKGEAIVASLLRDHLGARPREEQPRVAAEARRAKNPRPERREERREDRQERAPRSEDRREERPAREERPTREERVRPPPPPLPAYQTEEDEPGDLARIFVNIGKRDGASPDDIQRLLESGAGLRGAIRMRDRNTFVSVPRESLEKAIAALAGQSIGGRTITAEVARERA